MTDKKKRRTATAARPAHVPDEVARAYAVTEREMQALAAERVGQVTTDIPTAVSLALGAIPSLESLVPAMKELLAKPPLDEIARLHVRALATLYTHLQYVPKPKRLEEELEEARVLREQLLASADAHVVHGQIDAESIARIREGSGHLDRANDLIALAALFQSAWEQVGAKTQITADQLERASALGTALIAELGSRALGGTGAMAGDMSWSDRRNRAFRLFITDYDAIRRAVEYVRYHEGDAAAYVPPLHTRKRSTASAKQEPASDLPSPIQAV